VSDSSGYGRRDSLSEIVAAAGVPNPAGIVREQVKEFSFMSRRITMRPSSSLSSKLRLAVAALALVLLPFRTTSTLFAQVQPQPGADATTSTSEPDSTMSLGVGRSKLVKTPFPSKTISIVDKKIADVQVISPTQVLVSGTGVGTTDLVMYDAEGHAQHVEIVVTADRSQLMGELKRILPGSNIDVRPSHDAVVISGTLSRAEDVERLAKYMEVQGVKYVDLTSVPGVQQVQIKVVIAEASRTAIRSLNINAGFSDGKSFGASNVDLNSFGLATNQNGLHVFGDKDPTGAVTLFGRGFVGQTLIEAFVAALAENQYLRVLAEPSLVAISGEEASFLAGGEFPIPVVQGAGASANGTSISIDYKKFGVQLRFRPTVTGEGNIRLHVAPEVSELSNVGALQIQGFSIPGLLTRRSETTVELKSGQSFGMAGLISRSTQARSARVPGLGDLPVLGAMFRSVRYQEGNTELLLLVTASLVEPMSLANRPPMPSEFHVAPNDWELYSLARIEGETPSRISSSDAEWLRRAGLDKLRGPGAWATFETQGAMGSADIVSASQGVGSGGTSVLLPASAPQTLSSPRRSTRTTGAGTMSPRPTAGVPARPNTARPTTRPSTPPVRR
jgi:pilus assembly protein CpaC